MTVLSPSPVKVESRELRSSAAAATFGLPVWTHCYKLCDRVTLISYRKGFIKKSCDGFTTNTIVGNGAFPSKLPPRVTHFVIYNRSRGTGCDHVFPTFRIETCFHKAKGKHAGWDVPFLFWSPKTMFPSTSGVSSSPTFFWLCINNSSISSLKKLPTNPISEKRRFFSDTFSPFVK